MFLSLFREKMTAEKFVKAVLCALKNIGISTERTGLVISSMAGIKFTFKNFGLKKILKSSFAPHAISNAMDGILLGWTLGLPFFIQGKIKAANSRVSSPGRIVAEVNTPCFTALGYFPMSLVFLSRSDMAELHYRTSRPIGSLNLAGYWRRRRYLSGVLHRRLATPNFRYRQLRVGQPGFPRLPIETLL